MGSSSRSGKSKAEEEKPGNVGEVARPTARRSSPGAGPSGGGSQGKGQPNSQRGP